MGQQNTDSIQHIIDDNPNWYRDQELYQIVNDISEELTGKGFTQIARPVLPDLPFVSKITIWNENPDSPPANPNAKKRVETNFSRTGPFISGITTNIYSEDGLTIVAIITATVTRTGQNIINSSNVTVVRN